MRPPAAPGPPRPGRIAAGRRRPGGRIGRRRDGQDRPAGDQRGNGIRRRSGPHSRDPASPGRPAAGLASPAAAHFRVDCPGPRGLVAGREVHPRRGQAAGATRQHRGLPGIDAAQDRRRRRAAQDGGRHPPGCGGKELLWGLSTPRDLQSAYPNLADAPIWPTPSAASLAEQAAVAWVAKLEPAAALPLPGMLATTIFAQRTHESDAPDAEGHVVFAVAAGAVYGTEAASGKVLWRKFVGWNPWQPHGGGLPCPVTPQSGDVVLAAASHGEIQRIEATTGRTRWRHVDQTGLLRRSGGRRRPGPGGHPQRAAALIDAAERRIGRLRAIAAAVAAGPGRRTRRTNCSSSWPTRRICSCWPCPTGSAGRCSPSASRPAPSPRRRCSLAITCWSRSTRAWTSPRCTCSRSSPGGRNRPRRPCIGADDPDERAR